MLPGGGRGGDADEDAGAGWEADRSSRMNRSCSGEKTGGLLSDLLAGSLEEPLEEPLSDIGPNL